MSLLSRVRQGLHEARLVAEGRVVPGPRVEAEATPGVEVVWPTSYGWPMFSAWMDSLRSGFEALGPISEGAPLDAPRHVVPVRFRVGGTERLVAFDVGDDMSIPDENPGRYFLYFKMQFDRAGYPHANVVPGGYVPFGNGLYRCLGPLRRIRDRRDYLFDVHGRFGTGAGYDRRKVALDALAAQRSFRFEGGFRMMRHSSFLTEVARSRVCVDLPGNGDFCFRLVDYLSVGSCVVAWRHRTRLPAELEDGRHLVLVEHSGEAVVEACERLLAEPARAERMALEARAYFDRHLHRSAMAARILRVVSERHAMDAPTEPSAP